MERYFDKVLGIAKSTEYIKHQYETIAAKDENVNFIRNVNGSWEKVDVHNYAEEKAINNMGLALTTMMKENNANLRTASLTNTHSQKINYAFRKY